MTAGKRIAAAMIIFAGGAAGAIPFYRPGSPDSGATPPSQVEPTTKESNVPLQISSDEPAVPADLPVKPDSPVPTPPEQNTKKNDPVSVIPPAPPPEVSREFPPGQEKVPPAVVDRRPPLRSREQASEDGDGPKLHRIRDGDTLRDLAKRYLGNAERWSEIFQANRHILKDAEVLPIGKEIRIPLGTNPQPESQAPPSAPDAGPTTTLVPIP